jgi:hypothetical protein
MLLLAERAKAPKYHFGLLHQKPVTGRRLQAGGFADRTVYVGDCAAAATDDVMVVVSHSRFIARGVAGRLDAPDEPRFFQNVQIIVNGLRGERAQPLARNPRDGVRVPVLSFANQGSKHGKSGRGNPQACPAKGVVMPGFVGLHRDHYEAYTGTSQ